MIASSTSVQHHSGFAHATAPTGETGTSSLPIAAVFANVPDEKAATGHEPTAAGPHGSAAEEWVGKAVRHLKDKELYAIAITHYQNADPGLSQVDAGKKFAAALADTMSAPVSNADDSERMNRLRKLLRDTGILHEVAQAAFMETKKSIQDGARSMGLSYDDLIKRAQASAPGTSFQEAEKTMIDALSIEIFVKNFPYREIEHPAATRMA
jgi:hypothetical protein